MLILNSEYTESSTLSIKHYSTIINISMNIRKHHYHMSHTTESHRKHKTSSQGSLELPIDLLHLLHSPLVALLGLNHLHILSQMGILLLQGQSQRRRNKREAHHNISSRQLLSAEIRSTTRGGLQALLKEIKVPKDIPRKEGLFNL